MILIVGCGFLGNYLLKYICANTDEKVIATVRDMNHTYPNTSVKYLKCDITVESDIRNLVAQCNNEELTVFYFASCHYIDNVFENPDEAKKVNVSALENFLRIVPNIKSFFYASTDCVYGEGKDRSFSFTENSKPNPINEYGKQKALAEKIVYTNGFTVLRFPFMLGPSLTEKPHFYDNIYSALKNNKEFELIDGMKRSVISYSQAAELIYRLSILKNIPQIINVCGDQTLGKYEIGCLLAQKKNLCSKNLIKIPEAEGKKFFKDTRASYIAMDNSLLKSLLNINEILWEDKIC